MALLIYYMVMEQTVHADMVYWNGPPFLKQKGRRTNETDSFPAPGGSLADRPGARCLATGGEPDRDAQVLTADEVSGTPRLDELDPQTRDAAQTPAYEPDEMVTVIVELAEAPTLDRYEAAPGLAGEAVSQYLASSAVKTRRSALLGGQDAMVQSISRRTGTQVEVVSRWTDLLNAMAIQIPMANWRPSGLWTASSGPMWSMYMNARKRSCPQTPFPAPMAAATTWSAWARCGEAGFTGKGMLVAVLDTGLD